MRPGQSGGVYTILVESVPVAARIKSAGSAAVGKSRSRVRTPHVEIPVPMRAPVTVTIVGKGNSRTGMGKITHAWLHALAGQPGIALRFINTRPQEGDDVDMAGVEKITSSEGHKHPGDVAIFTDVLWNGRGDRNYEMCPSARLKYCHSVFDSTRVPGEWVDIANNHFDMVLVTTPSLISSFKMSGLCRPVMNLPLMLDLDQFQKASIKPLGKKFVFGLVGAYDFRKSIHMAAEAFEAAFGLDRPDVELRLKLSYSLLPEAEALSFAAKYRGTNVKISFGSVSDAEYLEFVQDIDCYINISRGEGYSIPAREAVALGKPLILSDHFAHRDLIGIDSVFFLRAEVPVPALYPQINERFIGLQYVPHKIDLIDAFQQLYNERKNWSAKGASNRDKAEAWSANALRSSYLSVVQPVRVALRGGDEGVTAGGIATQSTYYYQSLNKVYGDSVCRSARNREVLGTAPTKKIVVIGNDGGFFSLFNRYASYLVWEKDADPRTLVLPDWRPNAIKEYFGVSNFTSFCYGKPEDGNAWLNLFKPSPDVSDISIYNDGARLYEDAEIADDFNEKREPWLTYKHAYELYRMPEFKRWRRWYSEIVSKHIVPTDSIQRRIDKNLKRLPRGVKIGVHIRHPSHAIEQPELQLKHIDTYVRAINRYVREHDVAEYAIFLATDQERTVMEMKKAFGALVVVDPSVKRTTIADDDAFSELTIEEKMKEGHQIQHLTAANPDNWSTDMAAEVISDCYTLAQCDVLFHIVSNISTAASYINPELEMVYVGGEHG
jgi:hypothetical protein